MLQLVFWAAMEEICNGSDEPLSDEDLNFIFDSVHRYEFITKAKDTMKEIKRDGGLGRPIPDEVVEDRVLLYFLGGKLQMSRLVPRLLATLKEFMGLDDVEGNFTDKEMGCSCEVEEDIYPLTDEDLDYLDRSLNGNSY
jgi:hypothetical protein